MAAAIAGRALPRRATAGAHVPLRARRRPPACAVPLAAPLAAATAVGGALYLSALQLRFRGERGAGDASPDSTPTKTPDTGAFGEDDIMWGTMGVVSALPIASPLAWAFGWIATGERRYLAFCAMYAVPSLAAFSSTLTDAADGGASGGMEFLALLACVAHVQLERVAATENVDAERPPWLPQLPNDRAVTLPFFGGAEGEGEGDRTQAPPPLERSAAAGLAKGTWGQQSLKAKLEAEDAAEREAEAAQRVLEERALGDWDVRFSRRSATVKQLREECKEQGIEGYSRLRKAELVELLEAVDRRRAAERVLDEETSEG